MVPELSTTAGRVVLVPAAGEGRGVSVTAAAEDRRRGRGSTVEGTTNRPMDIR
jgi:hypothetical protein